MMDEVFVLYDLYQFTGDYYASGFGYAYWLHVMELD